MPFFVRAKPYRFNWRRKLLHTPLPLKWRGMTSDKNRALLWTRKARRCGNHDTTSAKPSRSASSSKMCNLSGNSKSPQIGALYSLYGCLRSGSASTSTNGSSLLRIVEPSTLRTRTVSLEVLHKDKSREARSDAAR